MKRAANWQEVVVHLVAVGDLEIKLSLAIWIRE